MTDIVKNMWNGILNDDKEILEEVVVEIVEEVVEEAAEFVAYLVKENDKGIYSTENGSRAFSVRKVGEVIEAAWTHELGTFTATTHTAFEIACKEFATEKSEWMEDGIVPEEITEDDKEWERLQQKIKDENWETVAARGQRIHLEKIAGKCETCTSFVEKNECIITGRTKKPELRCDIDEHEHRDSGFCVPECLAAFQASGYTGGGVAAYMDSRAQHDPMDDDPNRDRDRNASHGDVGRG